MLLCIMALTTNAQKCAVLEFKGSASISTADIDGISEMFMTYFRPEGYTMVERAQIDKVITEQRFQRSNLTDDQMVQIGKILNASKVVIGKVSRLGGQYQVDVRFVDVQSGRDVELEGATFTGDYRANVKNIATKLANKVAIATSGTSQSVDTPQKRTEVEILYGYLKIFPNDIGVFQSEPTTIINQINNQIMHGFNNWRIPSNEELSLLRANNYVGKGEYMTKENPQGIVLLVTDGDNYKTVQTKEQELLEAYFVDLGLPSKTLWGKENLGDWQPYQAITNWDLIAGERAKFFIIPTTAQMQELEEYCTWEWTDNGYNSGYKVIGPNGNYIFLPELGYIDCEGKQHKIGCYYWASDTSPYSEDLKHFRNKPGGSDDCQSSNFFEYRRRPLRPVHCLK